MTSGICEEIFMVVAKDKAGSVAFNDDAGDSGSL